ncbi:hypothetical protein [Hungatella hathewayi]|uniref:hypothetical protein n=1 Tax=Hungatella hathewayi TaxID=154046 RepID=UPI0035618463
MPIYISDYYDLESKNVIQFVFNEYERIFTSNELKKNIYVEKWDCEYALAAPKRQNPDQQEDYIIYLTAKYSYWCQIIYQFAHEMSHLVMNCYPESNKYKWISECLCGAASNYMLELSKKHFKVCCPSFVKNVQEYLQDHINKSSLPDNMEINKFIQAHLQGLESDPTEDGKTERARNNAIAVYLYKIIQKNESGWKAIELFEQIDMKGFHYSEEFINGWKCICRNESEKKFVDDFYKMIKGKIYLMDTIAFNKYYDYEKDHACKVPDNMNIIGLVDLFSNANTNGDNMWVHAATMYELLIRCYRNEKVQEKYKINNQVNIGQFADAYNFIIKKKLMILNESPGYFKWEKIVSHYNEGTNLYLKEYVEAKKSIEFKFLKEYILYVVAICSYAWYDEYKKPEEEEYRHNLNCFFEFSNSITHKIENKLNEILDKYYYNQGKKETVTKEVDCLLGYVLNKYKDVISNGRAKNDCSSIARCKFYRYIGNIDKENISNKICGAEYAKECISKHKKELNQYIEEFSKGVFDRFPIMTETSKLYLIHLVTNTLLQGAKITKNDASDYLIISVGDYYKDTENIVVITYDRKMKQFLEKNNIFYDKSIYDRIYK